jgi:hypothetical protein
MIDTVTVNGHDTTGGLNPPVTRPRDPTGASRARRYRDNKRKAAGASPVAMTEKAKNFKGRVTVPRDADVTNERSRKSNSVTPSVQLLDRVGWHTVTAYVAALGLAAVGIGLSAVGMVETATYALAAGGVLFCALAIAADMLTLTMPSVMAVLWHRRSPAVIVAGLLWCAGAVTVANLEGYVGEHVEQYQNGRQTLATGRSMALERLVRLKDERKAIAETRPPAAIAAALNDARRSERPALREALALAKRRDALDIELAAFEQRLDGIPQVATADASAAVLSDISGTTVSERELRRLRLALLLGLPLCGGLVLSLAFAVSGGRNEVARRI